MFPRILLAFVDICLVIISEWPPFVSQFVVVVVNKGLSHISLALRQEA